MHIFLSRTAQISLELHFCVELDTKKALFIGLPFTSHSKCDNIDNTKSYKPKVCSVLHTALLEWVSEYAVRAYTTADSAAVS